MTRVLAIVGSGETTPTMVTPHQQVLGRFPAPPRAVILDTPYGFQENAEDLNQRTRAYFERNVGHEVEVASLRRVGEDPLADETAVAAIRAADWVFAGPGSPSYLLRQWQGTAVPDALREKLRHGGAVVFASAAACTLGRFAVPVYEVYKVGQDPRWLDGLHLLAELDLDAVVIPHFDNAEGGTHDTRYCYLGERRLRHLEDELPDTTWILGVDEHTAAVADLDTGRVEVHGRGGLTVRTRDGSHRWEAGDTLSVDALRDVAEGRPGAPRPRSSPAAAAEPTVTPDSTPFLDAVQDLRDRFDRCLHDEDVLGAGEVALELVATLRDWSADTQQSDEADRAHAVLRQMIVRLARLADAGLHDHRHVVAPYVDALLDLRQQARRDERYDLADRIRDQLETSGIEVRDTADGTRWVYDRTDDPHGTDR